MKTLAQKIALSALVVASLPLAGCLEWWPELGIPAGAEPWGELNPAQYYFYSMHDTPSLEDQEAGMLLPPAGTVPTNFSPYPYGVNEAAKAASLANPVPVTPETLRYGKQMYETTCVVCHGQDARGAGYIVPPYPQPPDLTASRVRNWTDGEIYHVIANGQGRMWGYKSQLKEMERWAVVNYVRALQRASNPEPQDLERVTE